MGKKSGVFLWFTFIPVVALGFTMIVSVATGVFLPQPKFETRLPSFCHPPKAPLCDCPSVSSVSKNPSMPKNSVPQNNLSKNTVPEEVNNAAVQKAAKKVTFGNGIALVAIVFFVALGFVPYLLGNLMFYGEKINHWCITNNEARDQFKIFTLSIQFALHYLGDRNPYAVIASCIWVISTLFMCAAFTNRRLVRDVAAGSIPVSFAAMVDLFIKKSPCYAVVTSFVCAYSIAVWFLPDVPLYVYMPPCKAIFGRRAERAQSPIPLQRQRHPLQLQELQHISRKERDKSFDQLLRERSR